MQQTTWPELPYQEFQSTAHLLHMCVQMIGKLKLNTPFEPHWANVALWLTSSGLTSGLIPYHNEFFSIDIDFITHQINCTTSWGKREKFSLRSQSVSELYKHLFATLKSLQIDLSINPLPQEIPSPISFEMDVNKQQYNEQLANAWWRILLNSYRVMQRYHAKFNGETPPIGLMWGTFDLRDARYNGIASETTGINADYIRRNAMNEGQIEIGWWHGNEAYPRAAYYSYTYPKPKQIESAKIQPKAARWDEALQEFILDYDDICHANQPEIDLLAFFESTYQAGAMCANWNPKYITSGEPV
jgi:hypothetical protein